MGKKEYSQRYIEEKTRELVDSFDEKLFKVVEEAYKKALSPTEAKKRLADIKPLLLRTT